MTSCAHMVDISIMHLTREALIKLIDEAVEVRGWNRHRLASEAGVKYTSLVDFYRGKTAMLKAENLQKILFVLEEGGPRRVPVLGEVGAGGKVYPFDDIPLMRDGAHEADQAYVNCEFVDAPPGTYPTGVVAVRVRGESMMPFMPEGTVVYYKSRVEGGCDDFLSKLCVVQVADGPAYLKILRRGKDYGRYDLVSYNLDTIENAELEWCAKVVFVKLP